MSERAQFEEMAFLVSEVARLLGIPTQRRVDTFGRPCLDIPLEGLRLIHETAMAEGNVEVAEHVRQLLVHSKRTELPNGQWP